MKRYVFLLIGLLFLTRSAEPVSARNESYSISDASMHVHAIGSDNARNGFTAENYQRLVTCFTPYLGVFALRFTSALVHEFGHAISYWAIAKEWPDIVIGDNEDKQRLVFDAQKFKLFLPDEDTMSFGGSTNQSQTIVNRYLDVFSSLMGPIFGALFSYGMLQYVQQPLAYYAARAELFDNIVLSLLTHGDKHDESDGYWVLKVLQLPTSWLKDFENHEYDLANSMFDFLNLPKLVDLLMFCKLFQARSDNERIIMLGGQLFFRVMVPYVINTIKELYQWGFDYIGDTIDQAEKLVQKTDSSTLFIAFSRFWLLAVIPVLFMHELIKLNARQPVKDYMTDCF